MRLLVVILYKITETNKWAPCKFSRLPHLINGFWAPSTVSSPLNPHENLRRSDRCLNSAVAWKWRNIFSFSDSFGGWGDATKKVCMSPEYFLKYLEWYFNPTPQRADLEWERHAPHMNLTADLPSTDEVILSMRRCDWSRPGGGHLDCRFRGMEINTQDTRMNKGNTV